MSAEERIIRAASLGEPNAFEELINPSLGRLRGWLGYVLDQDADDCLQEVLLTAWLKLPALHDPAKFRGWLFQIARHKSLDYLRRRQRTDRAEVPLEAVEGYLNRQTTPPPSPRLDELVEPLTEAERTAIWLHYAEGLSIAQIAHRRSVSSGTIKRLLHNARNRLRRAASPLPEGALTMSTKPVILLPTVRPTISILPLTGESFAVDFREDPWYFAPLEAGGQTQWASYDPPDWHRTSVSQMVVLGQAVIHGETAWEIQADEYVDGAWNANITRHYVQLGNQSLKYLAVLSHPQGIPHLDTFLDERFHEKWGQRTPRHWRDEGRFVNVHENQYVTVDPNRSGGAGYFSVTIGERTFNCLRVLDTAWANGSDGLLVEAYLSPAGQTMLFRRYNGEAWHPASGWRQATEHNHRIVLDGVTYIHWYDCLSSAAIS